MNSLSKTYFQLDTPIKVSLFSEVNQYFLATNKYTQNVTVIGYWGWQQFLIHTYPLTPRRKMFTLQLLTFVQYRIICFLLKAKGNAVSILPKREAKNTVLKEEAKKQGRREGMRWRFSFSDIYGKGYKKQKNVFRLEFC